MLLRNLEATLQEVNQPLLAHVTDFTERMFVP